MSKTTVLVTRTFYCIIHSSNIMRTLLLNVRSESSNLTFYQWCRTKTFKTKNLPRMYK